ncbi:NAD(P)/FAD-dependent oxidoreductase [uncultured Duncaniella sp.]|uniref:NAD(P)/FAD-dependent oxidoreductase n=1 Tax=uncultured Duncaniella sp. TaxID=2768039 RepID=UPI0025AA08D5|nr:NAD(P)/FAD-dependent oxidoreductase [uncultured Duncaniella sp.]
MSTKQKIVVIGGGFAGLNFVKKIDKSKFDVTLVDKHNYHTFPPLFYQVASSELDPTSICFPLRRELRKRNCHGVAFHIGKVRKIDVAAKTISTDYETTHYDKLVIALGTTNNFFGNKDLIKDVYTLKSTDQAIRIRNEILFRCERAAVEPDNEKRRRMLSFVVIGGGPAGVEIAGAVGELKRYILKRDYPGISPDDLSITIIEGTDRLLGTMSRETSDTALRDLNQLMVEVKLGRLMKTYNDNVITLDDGSTIYSEMVIWTAGVTGVPIEFSGTAYKAGRGGRFPTDQYCRIEGLEDIYAIGDIGLMTTDKYPKGLPQLAQVAIQQGRFLAKNFNSNKRDRPFSYVDKGSMATIGRNRAVADLHSIHLSGFIAWLAWMFIHLISLLGMRNKINVLINWIWAYFSYNTSLRLLLAGSKYPKRGELWDKG